MESKPAENRLNYFKNFNHFNKDQLGAMEIFAPRSNDEVQRILKDIEELDIFYFKLLDKLSHKLIKQNPKRAICKSYLKLLKHEGRLHTDFNCFLCEQDIQTDISLVRSFMPVHSSCSYSRPFNIKKIEELFLEKSLISFEDEEIDYLWNILLQGL